MLLAGIQSWRLTAGGENNLGLCYTEEGFFLGRTSLIERRAGRYLVRSHADLKPFSVAWIGPNPMSTG
jgi:hypothetical protein